MRMVRLGRTEELVSHLGCGTMWFRNLSQADTDAAVGHALDRGITYFDCARAYGDAEIKLGRALGARRDRAFIATKTNKRDAAAVSSEIEESRQRLDCGAIDLLQLHYVNSPGDFDAVMAPGGALEAARRAQGDGHVRYVGITGHRPEKLAEWLQTEEFDTVLFHLNPIQPFAATELMPTARRLDVGTLAMRPTGSGLTTEYRSFLRYVESNRPNVVVSGLPTPEIVDENIANLERAVEPPEIVELAKLADTYGANLCRRCNYCSCPVGIEVPEAMMAETLWRNDVFSQAGREAWSEAIASVDRCAGHEPCQTQPICESKCPYDLPIRETMMRIAHDLETS